jgi:hypothetical protein
MSLEDDIVFLNVPISLMSVSVMWHSGVLHITVMLPYIDRKSHVSANPQHKIYINDANSVNDGQDVIDYDNMSFDSDDDWGTPPHTAEAKDASDEVSESDEEEILGRRPRIGGSAKGRKAAGRRVSHSPSFSPSASANGGKCTAPATLESHSPLSDSDYLDEATLGNPRSRNDSPGIFVAEDEELPETDQVFVVKGTSTLTTPQTLLRKPAGMDGLKRARAIKAEIKNNIPVLQSPDKATGPKRNVEEDPENDLIKTLRDEQNMKWTDIANFLNQERRNRGEPAIWTSNAVYCRFVISAPRVAVPISEIGFDPKDYKHLHNPGQFSTTEGTGAPSKVGKKRIKNFDNAKELEANMRKQVKPDEHVELETAEKTEQLMQAVAKVERNFWVLVADEMERATTKMYPPSALASRYHAI